MKAREMVENTSSLSISSDILEIKLTVRQPRGKIQVLRADPQRKAQLGLKAMCEAEEIKDVTQDK
jgi:hypothetical protein